MATVNKDFKIKSGLVVEGATATVGGFSVLTKKQDDQDYIVGLIGGTATSANTADTVVKRDANGDFAAGTITADLTGQVSDISNHDTADLAEGTNLYFTNQRALDATSAAYDVIGAAAAAESAANGYTDGRETAITTAYQSYADTAEQDAKNYADDLINDASNLSTEVWSAYKTATEIGVAQTAAEAYTDGRETAITTAYEAYADQAELDAVATANAYTDAEVAALVDSAPELLDTLNELAAAIGDNPNYAADLATSVGERVAKAGDTMTGLLVLSADPSANLGAATKQYVDQAEADAISTAEAYTDTREGAITTAYEAYADQAETDAIASAAADATTKANAAQAAAEATAAAANTAQQNGTTSFTAINYNSVAKQVAATTGNIVTAAETTAISWVAADYRSAKFVVKVKNGVHTQVSDLVVTLDTSNNVAVSEYGITYSNGTELAAVTADYSGSDVRIRVTPANANTEVIVVGTLIK